MQADYFTQACSILEIKLLYRSFCAVNTLVVTPTVKSAYFTNMAEAQAVSVKLPTFWTQQPEVWFLQVEAQFGIRKITDDITKFYYIVLALDQATSNRVLDVLVSPPSTNKEVCSLENSTFGQFGTHTTGPCLQITESSSIR